MPAPAARTTTGKPDVDELIDQLVTAADLGENADLIRSMLVTSLDMSAAELDRLNLKIASQTLAEMLNSWKIFSPYNNQAKVTIFGSARTQPEHPDYQLAVEFGCQMRDREWMAITGAGPGIMTAGIEGIGVDKSFGVSIVLPFEANAAPIIDGDEKLATYRYFFTRKLTFMKETDAFCLFPGGFGTQDEAFELLTLIQTGKSYPAPIVLLDHPGSTYWAKWVEYVNDQLLEDGLISEPDMKLFLHTHDPVAAADYLTGFYSTYHSVRTVRRDTVIRLRSELSDASLKTLNEEFADIVVSGKIEKTEPTVIEIKEQDCVDLPRLTMRFNSRATGRLIAMINRINELGGVKDSDVAKNLVHDVSPEED